MFKIYKTRNLYRTLFLFLSVVGPGVITANIDNDANGITVYSVIGAHYGLDMLWILLPILFILIIVQEMSARMGVVTGKGLADLIREQFGAKTTFYMLCLLVFCDLGNTMGEFAGIAASAEVLGVSKYIVIPVCVLLIWLLIIKGTYKIVEKVFLVSCCFYLTYVISGFMANPNWMEVGESLVHPRIHMTSAYWLLMVGCIGTSITPWMQFYLQSAIVEKKIKLRQFKYTRWDIVAGCISMNVISLFIIVACATVLHKQNIRIDSAKNAAIALYPIAGKFCSFLFAFGLFMASFFAAGLLPLATSYYVCEGLGWEKGIDKSFREAPGFFGLYTAILFIGAAVILYPDIPLIKIMVFSQILNGILLPFVLIFIIKLVNNKDIMGTYINGPYLNKVAWGITILLITMSAISVVSYFV